MYYVVWAKVFHYFTCGYYVWLFMREMELICFARTSFLTSLFVPVGGNGSIEARVVRQTRVGAAGIDGAVRVRATISRTGGTNEGDS